MTFYNGKQIDIISFDHDSQTDSMCGIPEDDSVYQGGNIVFRGTIHEYIDVQETLGLDDIFIKKMQKWIEGHDKYEIVAETAIDGGLGYKAYYNGFNLIVVLGDSLFSEDTMYHVPEYNGPMEEYMTQCIDPSTYRMRKTDPIYILRMQWYDVCSKKFTK